MSKIYVFAVPTGRSSYGVIQDAEPTGDTRGFAYSENKELITSHYSSGINWTMHDMGITSDWKKAIYEEKYPEGYELIWLGQFDSVETAFNHIDEMKEGRVE